MIFNEMRSSVDFMLAQIHDQPFNLELCSGILPQEKFIYYLVQDSLYLSDYSRALALTAARLTDNQHTQQFIEFALGAIKAERDLHINYLQKHEGLHSNSIEQNPTCFMYTNYLLKMASTASVEEAVASLLPCFWIYQEVGRQILQAQADRNNPYRNWIDLYAGTEFELSVQTAIEIVNELGASASIDIQKKMVTAFARSTQLEWLFWDSAYKQEAWPLAKPSLARSSLSEVSAA